jgi:hypothetical protein
MWHSRRKLTISEAPDITIRIKLVVWESGDGGILPIPQPVGLYRARYSISQYESTPFITLPADRRDNAHLVSSNPLLRESRNADTLLAYALRGRVTINCGNS